MSALDHLLEVQAHDTAADQLRHRRETLPQRAEVDAATADSARLDARIAELRDELAELARQQRRREDEVATLDDRWSTLDRTLYSGSVTSPKELQDLQDEQGVIKRRQRHLEDEVLELMERSEPLDAEANKATAERDAIDERVGALRAELAEAETEIDAELASVDQARSAEAGKVPVELLEEYEAIRSRMGGIGAARLVGGTCSGCNLALSAVEVDRIRKLGPDEPAHCEECGRILVR